MAEAVYVLCAITSSICAALLIKAYLANRTALLLAASICFVGLAANNVLLFVDLVIVPTVDLGLIRALVALAAMLVLVFGLVLESP